MLIKVLILHVLRLIYREKDNYLSKVLFFLFMPHSYALGALSFTMSVDLFVRTSHIWILPNNLGSP
jgi:hypothetical protein